MILFSLPLQFCLLLLLIFTLEVVTGMLAYIYYGQVEQDLESSLPDVFADSYSVDERKTKAIDHIQQEVLIIVPDIA